MSKKIEDYRVQEGIDGFVIQLKNVVTNTFGRLWWKETITKEFWDSLNEKGKRTFGSFINPPTEAKIYSSLEEAEKAIEGFVKYPIYHYFKSDDSAPEMPKDRIEKYR